MFCVLVGIVPPPLQDVDDTAWAGTFDAAASSSPKRLDLLGREVAVGALVEDDASDEASGAGLWRFDGQWSLVLDTISTVAERETQHDGKGEATRTTPSTIPTLLVAAVGEPPATPDDVVAAMESYWNMRFAHPDAGASRENEAAAEDTSSYRCELWASAPAPLPLRPPSGYPCDLDCDNFEEPQESPTSPVSEERLSCSWADRAADAMREWGIVRHPGGILDSRELIDEIRRIVDAKIATVESDLARHRPALKIGRDDFCFREIASRNRERFDLRLDDSEEAVELVRQHVVSRPNVSVLLERVLGCSCSSEGETGIDFDVSVVYSRPGACAQGWHADGDHQRGTPDAGFDSDWKFRLAAPYAVCLFVPLIDLDDFNDDVGYTQFWPGSHRHRDLVGFGRVAELAHATYDGMGACKAGDGVWYDYRLLHRGMPNNSKRGTVRPVLQVIFKRRWYLERANYGEDSIAQSTTETNIEEENGIL